MSFLTFTRFFLMFPIILLGISEVKSQAQTITWTKILDGHIESIDWDSSGTYLAYRPAQSTASEVSFLSLDTMVTTSMPLPEAEGKATVVWSPDGKIAAVATNQELYLIDRDTLSLTTAEINVTGQISWSPDSSQIFVFTKASLANEVYIYDIETKSFTLFLRVPSLGITYDTFFDLSPNGSLLALPNDSTHSIGFWDLTPQLLERWTRNALENAENACVPFDRDFTNIATVKWNAEGNVLAVGSNSTAGLDLCILLESNLVIRHLDSVATYAVDWSPDGKYLASGTFQWDDLGVGCEIRLFDVENNFEKSVATIEQDVCSVFSIAWAPDSQKIAVATNHGLWIGEVSNLSE